MNTEMNEDTEELNYILQNKNFQKIARSLRLSCKSRALYDQLLDINNSMHWKKTMLITNQRLMELLGTRSWDTVNKARKGLIDAGLIGYIEGRRGVPGIYILKKLYDPVPDIYQALFEIDEKLEEREREKINIAIMTCEAPEEVSVDNSNFVDNAVDKPVDNSGETEAITSETTHTSISGDRGSSVSSDRGPSILGDKGVSETGDTPSREQVNINKHSKTLENSSKHTGNICGQLSEEEMELQDDRLIDYLIEWFEEHRGRPMHKQERKALRELVENHTQFIILDAIKKADEWKGYSVNYVKKIIENWLKGAEKYGRI